MLPLIGVATDRDVLLFSRWPNLVISYIITQLLLKSKILCWFSAILHSGAVHVVTVVLDHYSTYPIDAIIVI